MLTYDLSNRKNLSLYEYLYRSIKQDILDGHLKAEEKLPSKRKLAEHLGISVITVEHAYSQLLVEGYIYSIVKKGYFISPLEEEHRRMFPGMQNTDTARRQTKKEEPEYLYDFHSNAISAEHFPFSVWSRLMRQVLAEQDKELLRKSPCNGALVLRQAIAGHLYQFRGMHVLPEQILIGAGTEYLYSLLIQLLGREKVFAVENPGYPKIAKIYEQNQTACAYIPLDEQGLSVKELRQSRADIVHISPAHHFPTGIVMPIRRRQELLAWANESSRYIIEDDYDSEFRFLGKPIQTLQSIDTGGRVIYINTFSKSIAPSIRISYMVLPPLLLKQYYERMGFYSCTVSGFEQYALAKFISGGYFEKHISRMKNYYRKQRNCIISAIRQSPLQQRAQILEKNAGLHFLLKLRTTRTDEEIVRAAGKKGIKISCLSEYYNKQDISSTGTKESTLVLNYSGIAYDKIPEAIRLLSEAVL